MNRRETAESTECLDVAGCTGPDSEPVRAAAKNLPKMKVGYLYFIQCNGPTGPVKIGYAKDVDARLSNIRMSNPYPLALLASVHIENPDIVEGQLHTRLAKSRLRGEWFACTPELLAITELATSHVHERLDARVTGREDPPVPPEFSVAPWGETEPIDQKISAHCRLMIERIRFDQREAREASDQRRRESLSYAPKRERAEKPKPESKAKPADLEPGVFVWRGKIRKSA